MTGWQWRPTAGGGRVEDLPLNEWVGQALGSASMCWANPGGAGEFDSVRCAQILDAVMAHLNAVIDQVIAGTTRAVAPVEGRRVTPAMREIIDRAAGREHSADGPVVQAFGGVFGVGRGGADAGAAGRR